MDKDVKELISRGMNVARPVTDAAGYYIMMRAMSYVVGWIFGALIILAILIKLAC